MLPYKTIIKIDSASRVPKYLQITNEFIKNISSGIIVPGTKLPGSRQFSELLGINRRTVIAAFDELASQGWIIVTPNKGCYVKKHLPEIKPKLISNALVSKELDKVSFSIRRNISHAESKEVYDFKIDDGYPDVRLAPLKELAKNYSYILASPMSANLMNYRQKIFGDEVLRQELVKYLAETRSIHVDIDNVMTTRGSLMAFYILFKTILTKKENEVVVGYPGFNEGNETIKLAGGNLNYVEVDTQGMRVDQLEILCKKKNIRAVFIIPHHHYPTTVSLSASRRMELLKLAEKYEFAIVEDDYDYDFHYSSAPILPIASTDAFGSVAYVGSFSKTIAPSLRLGFIVAPKELIREASYVSRSIDSFGNIAMERAVAMMFKDGTIRRHLKKALKSYQERRDVFCELLRNELDEFMEFKVPEGGLAIWAHLKKHDLKQLTKLGIKNRIAIPDGSGYYSKPYDLNAIRIGFASMTNEESKKMVSSFRRMLVNAKS